MTVRLKHNVPLMCINNATETNVLFVKFVSHNQRWFPQGVTHINDSIYYATYNLDIWFKFCQQEEVSSAKFVVASFMTNIAQLYKKEIDKILETVSL